MQNSPSPLLTSSEVDQNPTYINTEILGSDQSASSLVNSKPVRKQRKFSKVSVKKPDEALLDQQQTSSSDNVNSELHAVQYQNASSTFNELKTIPEYKPFAPQSYQQYLNNPPMPGLVPQIPFNPYNPYLPLPFASYGSTSTTTSYPYTQFAQHREAPRTSAMQNMMQMSFPSLPTTDLYHQQPLFGLSELESRLTSTLSQMTSQSRAWMDSQAMKRRHHDSGAMSAFDNCKKPRRGSVSTLSNYTDGSSSNSPYLTQHNDLYADSLASSGHQIQEKKSLYPTNVIDEKFDFSCVICQETKKDTVLLPCRHLCVCEKCCMGILVCPLCRKKFSEIMTVFT